MNKLTVIKDLRNSDQIDVSEDANLYFAKLAYEYYGNAIRDNSINDWIELGIEIERDDE